MSALLAPERQVVPVTSSLYKYLFGSLSRLQLKIHGGLSHLV